jgi:D-glycerate 3-kinase
LELVFFEGWMSGFRPVGEAAAAAVEASLVEVDRQLGAYQAAWDSLVDAWLVIRIGDPQVSWHSMSQERKIKNV